MFLDWKMERRQHHSQNRELEKECTWEERELLRQSKLELEKNFQTQSSSEGSECVKNKEQIGRAHV